MRFSNSVDGCVLGFLLLLLVCSYFSLFVFLIIQVLRSSITMINVVCISLKNSTIKITTEKKNQKTIQTTAKTTTENLDYSLAVIPQPILKFSNYSHIMMYQNYFCRFQVSHLFLFYSIRTIFFTLNFLQIKFPNFCGVISSLLSSLAILLYIRLESMTY